MLTNKSYVYIPDLVYVDTMRVLLRQVLSEG